MDYGQKCKNYSLVQNVIYNLSLNYFEAAWNHRLIVKKSVKNSFVALPVPTVYTQQSDSETVTSKE